MTPQTKPLSVLIVDDSPAVRETLRDMLASLDEVRLVGEADDVPRSMRALDMLQPDVVILDYFLPGGSSLDVLAHAQTLPAPPTVICFSTFTHAYLKAAALKRGADYFFDKDTEFERVAEIIQTLARSNRPSGRPAPARQCN